MRNWICPLDSSGQRIEAPVSGRLPAGSVLERGDDQYVTATDVVWPATIPHPLLPDGANPARWPWVRYSFDASKSFAKHLLIDGDGNEIEYVPESAGGDAFREEIGSLDRWEWSNRRGTRLYDGQRSSVPLHRRWVLTLLTGETGGSFPPSYDGPLSVVPPNYKTGEAYAPASYTTPFARNITQHSEFVLRSVGVGGSVTNPGLFVWSRLEDYVATQRAEQIETFVERGAQIVGLGDARIEIARLAGIVTYAETTAVHLVRYLQDAETYTILRDDKGLAWNIIGIAPVGRRRYLQVTAQRLVLISLGG